VLVDAVASCLPREEGLSLVLATMTSGSARDEVAASSLKRFRDERVVDWMEQRVAQAGTGGWGELAAYSGMSWARAADWLSRGRPLSLVALDALRLIPHHADPARTSRALPLRNPAPREEMVAALRRYAERDPVPRVTSTVDAIIRRWVREWSESA
jgi:hypothetical protein